MAVIKTRCKQVETSDALGNVRVLVLVSRQTSRLHPATISQVRERGQMSSQQMTPADSMQRDEDCVQRQLGESEDRRCPKGNRHFVFSFVSRISPELYDFNRCAWQ